MLDIKGREFEAVVFGGGGDEGVAQFDGMAFAVVVFVRAGE